MEKDTIITLEDNEKFVLLDEVKLENGKYFLALKLTEDEQPTKKYEIFEEEIEDGESYMSIVEDANLKEALMVNFTLNYEEYIENYNEEATE